MVEQRISTDAAGLGHLPEATRAILGAIPEGSPHPFGALADAGLPRPLPRVGTQTVALGPVVLRALTWSRGLLRLAVTRIRLKASGTLDDAAWGVALRTFFTEVGGTAVKIGQQLSNRVDFLPYPVCRELSALTDSAPPFTLAEALPAIERAIGARLENVFEVIDPQPVGSASIACVFQARLRDGRRVAVKVRRPGIRAVLAADVRLVQAATRALEALTVVRPGWFQHLRTGLEQMLGQELDLAQEARYQRLFRRQAKAADIPWVTAPRVHHALCSHEVLVSDFVSGVQGTELLAAVDSGDELSRAWLRRHGVDPKVVARRLFKQQMWRRREEAFFHGDPHHGNFIVQPGNKLVLLDFGSCGITSAVARDQSADYVHYMEQLEVTRASELTIGFLAPLPRLDIERLRSSMRREMWTLRLARSSTTAPWWERSQVATWLATARVARECEVPMGPSGVSMMRAMLFLDTIAMRLDPDLDADKLMADHPRWAGPRLARRAQKRHGSRRDRRWRAAAELARTRETVRWMRLYLGNLTRRVAPTYASVAKKGAYAARVLLRLGARLVGMLLLVLVGIALASAVSRPPLQTTAAELIAVSLRHPLFWLPATLLVLQATRRIRLRIAQPEAG